MSEVATAYVTLMPSARGFLRNMRRQIDPAVRSSGSSSGKSWGEKFKSGMAGTLKGITKTLAAGFVVGGLAVGSSILSGMAGQAVALVGGLGQAVGVAGLLPAVLAGGAAVIGTLVIGMQGFGDAMKAVASGDAKKLDAAMKGLSPNAQKFVTSLQKALPAIKGIKNAVQDRLFAGLGPVFGKALTDLGPIAKRGFARIAGGLNAGLKSTFKAVDVPANLGAVRGVFKDIAKALRNASAAAGPLVSGLIQFVHTGATFLPQLGSGFANIGKQIGAFLTRISQDGTLKRWISNGMTLVSQLGRVLRNVGSILGSVFSAGASQGRGLITSLEGITSTVATFLKSFQGQQALSSFFQAASSGAKLLGPILTALAPLFTTVTKAISPIAQQFGPLLVQVIKTLTPGIQAVVGALGPFVKALSPAFVKIAGALTQVMKDLAPALAPVGKLIAAIVSALAPLIAPISKLVGALLPPLVSLFTSIAQALAPVINALVKALAPVIPQLAAAFGQFVKALAPAWPALAQILKALIPLIPPLAQLLVQVVKLATSVLPILIPLLKALAPVIGVVASVLSKVIGVLTTVVRWVTNVVTWFSHLKSNLTSIVPTLVGAVIGFFKNMWSRVTGIVSSLVNSVVGWFRSLPGKVGSAVAGLLGRLVGFFGNVKNAVVGVVTHLIDAVVSWFKGLPGKLVGAVEALANIGGIIKNFLWSGLKGAGSWLFDIGKNIIHGLENGLKSAAKGLGSVVKGIAGGITGVFSSVLGIFSPSRVMRDEIGKNIILGLVLGMTGNLHLVKKAAEKIAQTVGPALFALARGVASNSVSAVRKASGLLAQGLRDAGASSKVIERFRGKEASLARDMSKAATVAGQLTKAQQKLTAARQAYAQTFQSVKAAVLGSFDISQIQGKLAPDGSTLAPTAGDVTAAVKLAAGKAKTFYSVLKSLMKRGLPNGLLSQLAQAGPDALPQAQAIASASKIQFSTIKSAYGQLTGFANKTGTLLAKQMNGVGVTTAQGLVKGLETAQSQINRAIQRIGRGMIKTLKKELGIKSPSRVMRALGVYTGRGLTEGALSQVPYANKASQRLAGAITPDLSNRPAFGAFGAQPASSGDTYQINEATNATEVAMEISRRKRMAGRI